MRHTDNDLLSWDAEKNNLHFFLDSYVRLQFANVHLSYFVTYLKNQCAKAVLFFTEQLDCVTIPAKYEIDRKGKKENIALLIKVRSYVSSEKFKKKDEV